ncbi:MAG: circadian clock protein LdpA [Pleurocapsa sp.]
MNVRLNPLHSLQTGSWFKLICGASYQHLPAVRSLALAYGLAGADCIDVAADEAVITAAQEGIVAARQLSRGRRSPWLMVSINDGQDPHFRKAEFDATQCPSDCPQPCVGVCPANAISFEADEFKGVVDRLCYGCGRCLPICPSQLITTRSYVSTPAVVVPWIKSMGIDAIEIHTQVGHYADFKRVWQQLWPSIEHLKLLAISCTDAPNVIDYLRSLYDLISPLSIPLIWQTDGRSMSGDIGKGTTHTAIAFAQKVLSANLPGYVQLAGGTNNYTVTKLKSTEMLQQNNNQNNSDLNPINTVISGIAYGSYARYLLSPIIQKLEVSENKTLTHSLPQNKPIKQSFIQLEENQKLLNSARLMANSLVNQLKSEIYRN